MLPITEMISVVRSTVLCELSDGAGLLAVLRWATRLWSLVARGERRWQRAQERLGLSVPWLYLFSVTWRCNLRCAGCYAGGYRPGREMELADIERVIREACELGGYLFFILGGEPMMLPGLLDTLAGIKDGLFFLFTNGTTMQSADVDRLAHTPNVLPFISMEGDEALTNQRRGPGVGQKVADAMHALARAHVLFGTSTMVTHRNVRLVTSPEWFDRLWGEGVRFALLLDYFPFACSLDPSLVLTDQDRALKREALANRPVNARPFVANLPPDEYHGSGCQAAGTGLLHINADGCVEPCLFSHFAVDNVKDKPLVEVLGSPFFCRLRARFANGDHPTGECLLFAQADEVEAIARQTGALSTEG